MSDADLSAHDPPMLRVKSIFSPTATAPVAQHLGALRHPLMLALALCQATGLALVWRAHVAAIPLCELAGLFLLTLACAVLVAMGCVRLLLRRSSGAGPVTLHLTLPVALSVALGLWAGGVYGRGLADPAAVPDMGLMFLWLWLGSEVLVALFVRFGLPLTLNAHRPISRGDAPSSLAPGPGGSPALSDLVMIRSDGRQVILTTRRDSARAAGPLRKWVATLPEGSGTLIHRSLWVATPAVLGHHRRGRRLVIDLAGGHRVEVALSRQSAILCWLRGLAASRAPAASLRTDRPALRPLAHRFPDAARP